MDISVTVDEYGYFDPIYVKDLPVSGIDGHGSPTPTVREFAEMLLALPEQFQGLPVTAYCDEGLGGIKHGLHYEREGDPDDWTGHVKLW
jgi:hypothetical protein